MAEPWAELVDDEDGLAWALAESQRLMAPHPHDEPEDDSEQLQLALAASQAMADLKLAEESQLAEALKLSAQTAPSVSPHVPETPLTSTLVGESSDRAPARKPRKERKNRVQTGTIPAQPPPASHERQPSQPSLPPPTRPRGDSISSLRPPVESGWAQEHPSWHVRELPPVSPQTRVAVVPGRCPPLAPVIAWLRQEMRLEDNPALVSASATGRPVIPLWILPPDSEEGGWPLLGAARFWQHHALNQLQHALTRLGSALVLRDGRTRAGGTLTELLMVLEESGATDVFFCASYTPWHRSRDAEIRSLLEQSGIQVHEERGSILFAPWDARPDEKSGSQLGFGSVGWFLQACHDCPEPPPPQASPSHLTPPGRWPNSLALSALGLAIMPRRRDGTVVDWAKGIRTFWAAGEAGAHAALSEFLADAVRRFEGKQRHRADERNTAVISPFLRFGELSPRTVLHRVQESLGQRAPATFLRRFAWRDLAYWSLWRFPSLPSASFRPHYDQQWWSPDDRLFEAWCAAKTGYPLVDAAMTQLWSTGWLPNYMRHVCASFLVEFLNVDWRKGQRWFAETLVDADTAINAYMWQNGGHSGMDQWNFVMHPVFAAKTCDPQGDYVRTWLPQLSKLPVEYIHCPWEAPFSLRASCKVILGDRSNCNFPNRILKDLEASRRRSHQAVMSIRTSPEGRAHILPSGHEWIELRGRKHVLITRIDYREGKITTRQTAEAQWDKSRRDRSDALGVVMRDSEREAAHL